MKDNTIVRALKFIDGPLIRNFDEWLEWNEQNPHYQFQVLTEEVL